MKISLFCLAVFLSRVLGDHPINAKVTEPHQCSVNVSESSIKEFNESLIDGKKVIFFWIIFPLGPYDLVKPIPDDHFAIPYRFMWLYDGENGLPIYMNAPYDFEVRSLFILKDYTSTLTLKMNVSRSCNVSTISRVHFLGLVFRQLIKVVSPAPLPDKKSSAYLCYDINNGNNIPRSEYLAAKRTGVSRNILLRHCCKVKDYKKNYNDSIDLCDGTNISVAEIANLKTLVGLFLFLFVPLAFGFISKAKLNRLPRSFSLVHSASTGFENPEEFRRQFEIESKWLSENDPYYSVLIFIKWLLCFNVRSAIASRIRRSLAVISCMVIIIADLTLECFTICGVLESYLENNVPLGYKAMIDSSESSENTDYFFGGPYVWFSVFLIFGLAIINIPGRLCETIAYSTLHQRETFTFLAQDVQMLQRYGNLNVSNLHDYDLLHAILKSSVLTALNPLFWSAVIKRWFHRFRRIYVDFNNCRVIYQLIIMCVIIPLAFIFGFLCVCELLLCVVFCGCPLLQIFKAIPFSYTQKYIVPLFKQRSFRSKMLGVMCFLISFPVYISLFLSSLYVFLLNFAIICSYIIYIVIAVIAKPDAVVYIIFFSMFVYLLVSIANSISETYISLQKLSIALAEKVNGELVFTRLGENFIHLELVKRIVHEHHPIRYEIAKALIKLTVGVCILASCIFVSKSISMNMSAYVKIGLLIFTTMIPKFMSVLKDSVLDPRWDVLPILEAIHIFREETYPKHFKTPDTVQQSEMVT